MPTTSPFNDNQNGAEIRERLNTMWADWLAALESAVGKDGWSPLLRTVADGQRQVIELYDWFGGTAAKPATGFMGAAGLVANAAQAVDFRGPRGGPGPEGPANQLGVGSVNTSAAGTPAQVTITGNYPDQKINITIPRGDKGEIGNTPTVTVGNVVTGEPGTPVEVTPSGTPTELILNFKIPQGAKGTDGSGAGDMLKATYDPTRSGSVLRADAVPWSGVSGMPEFIAAGDTAQAARESVGLGNVNNTPDAEKPVSTLQQEALVLKVDKVAGKGLSTKDFTEDDKVKLDGIDEELAAKQDKLVSAENIKTVNGVSILGSGDLLIATSPQARIGDVHIGVSKPAEGVWLDCGRIYVQASYPELFSAIGFRSGGILELAGTIPNNPVSSAYLSGVIVAVGTNLALVSTDSGENWVTKTIPAGAYNTVIVVGNRFIAIGTNVCATSDDYGTTWISRTIPAGVYRDCVPFNSLLVAVGQNVAATSSDNGTTWATRTIPAGDYQALTTTSNYVIAVGSSGVCARSLNGATWAGLPAIGVQPYYELVTVGSRIIAFAAITVAVSDDLGASWTHTNINIGGVVCAINLDNTVIVAGQGTMYMSPDSGNSWLLIPSVTKGANGVYVRAFVRASHVLVGVGSGFSIASYTPTYDPSVLFNIPPVARMGAGMGAWMKAKE